MTQSSSGIEGPSLTLDDLMETARPDAALDSDMDETDEIADLEPSLDIPASDPLETAEIIDLNIAESSLPSVDEDQDLSFHDENTDDEEIIDLAVMEKALEADLLAIEADDDTDDEEEILELLDVEEPGSREHIGQRGQLGVKAGGVIDGITAMLDFRSGVKQINRLVVVGDVFGNQRLHFTRHRFGAPG